MEEETKSLKIYILIGVSVFLFIVAIALTFFADFSKKQKQESAVPVSRQEVKDLVDNLNSGGENGMAADLYNETERNDLSEYLVKKDLNSNVNFSPNLGGKFPANLNNSENLPPIPKESVKDNKNFNSKVPINKNQCDICEDIEIKTDKSAYNKGEEIKISVSINPAFVESNGEKFFHRYAKIEKEDRDDSSWKIFVGGLGILCPCRADCMTKPEHLKLREIFPQDKGYKIDYSWDQQFCDYDDRGQSKSVSSGRYRIGFTLQEEGVLYRTTNEYFYEFFIN